MVPSRTLNLPRHAAVPDHFHRSLATAFMADDHPPKPSTAGAPDDVGTSHDPTRCPDWLQLGIGTGTGTASSSSTANSTQDHHLTLGLGFGQSSSVRHGMYVGVGLPVGRRVVINPPSRPQNGVWFFLQASPVQMKDPFLPQIPKSYLRIKNGRMTISLLMKYLVNKLGLDNESEVEIICRGQRLQPYLTVQHVRDNIWCPRDVLATISDSPINHVMTLQYRRSTSTTATTSSQPTLYLPV